jgi:subtilisin family serine protease
MSSLVPFLVAVPLLGLGGAPPVVTAPGGADRSWVLVASADHGLPAGLDAAVDRAGGRVEHRLPQVGLAVVRGPQGLGAALGGTPGVSAVAGDALLPVDTGRGLGPAALPTVDPPFSGDDDVAYDFQWGLDAVDAPEAWATGATGRGARVAVVDTGFDVHHPDLEANVNAELSRSFVPGETVEWSGSGPFSHGTHVAGIIAAADNGIGVIGVAPEAELVLVKAESDATRELTVSAALQSIVYATDVDADVVNMSFTVLWDRTGILDPATGSPVPAGQFAGISTAVARVLRYAVDNGTLPVAAAGNDGVDLDADRSGVVAPAGYPGVVAVAATSPIGWAEDPGTDLDVPTSYTNHGRSVIDLAGPGGDIRRPDPTAACTVSFYSAPCGLFDAVLSTGAEGSWYWETGTSMAAPHVAGVAALVVGAHGGSMDARALATLLERTADDLGQPGRDPWFGAGRVNAHRAVTR